MARHESDRSRAVIVGLVCFLAAAANVGSPRINLVAAGLAAWILSLLV